MRVGKFFIPVKCISLALFSFFALTACNKDDDEKSETKPSMEGDLTYEMPAYAKVKSKIKLETKGVTSPKDVEYRWTSQTLLKDTVIAKSCEITVPDSLGVFSIILTASAEGYYSRTATFALTSIDPQWDGSIKERPRPQGTITDNRDGVEYGYTVVGDALWLTENVRWSGAGVPFSKSEGFDEIMGRLYSWDEATGGVKGEGLFGGPQGVCPEGWSVPTNEDWVYLANQLSGEEADHKFVENWKGLGAKVMSKATFNGEKLWQYSPDCEPENKFGWEAFPGGRSFNGHDNFAGLFEFGYWWSASDNSAESGQTTANAPSDRAYYRYIHKDNPDFWVALGSKNDFGASVRCVKKK